MRLHGGTSGKIVVRLQKTGSRTLCRAGGVAGSCGHLAIQAIAERLSGLSHVRFMASLARAGDSAAVATKLAVRAHVAVVGCGPALTCLAVLWGGRPGRGQAIHAHLAQGDAPLRLHVVASEAGMSGAEMTARRLAAALSRGGTTVAAASLAPNAAGVVRFPSVRACPCRDFRTGARRP